MKDTYFLLFQDGITAQTHSLNCHLYNKLQLLTGQHNLIIFASDSVEEQRQITSTCTSFTQFQ